MREIRNVFTGEVARVLVTPINGAHIVKIDGSSVEMHRGSETTALCYLSNMVESMPTVWAPITH